MKKVLFLLLMLSVTSLGLLPQTEEKKIEIGRTMEIIPTISAVGGQDGISFDSELIIAKRFTLTKNKKWFLFAQAGAMYNLYRNEFDGGKSTESQLGLEPLVGFGTNRFRISGFLNGLAVKDWQTGTMPFVEGGVRFSLTPWRKVWISVFGTWPISDPVFVNPLGEDYLENDEGLFLLNSELWAKQVKTYGADIDVGLGRKFVVNLDGFATDNDHYQLGAGLQYQLFKDKPWIVGGNLYYTNFQRNDYFYIHNVFPGMFGVDLEGYTFRLGISNYGGLGEINFSQMLGRISEPMFFSPVVKEVRKKSIRIGDKFKFDLCGWGGKCLDFEGSLCITSGVFPVKIFVSWGDGTSTLYTVTEPCTLKISHHYPTAGIFNILISGMDVLLKTFSYSGKFEAKDCNDDGNECKDITAVFEADRNSVKKGETVNLNWNVKGADEVLFDGKKVEFVVGKYPITFNELGKFKYTLQVFKKGKLCKELTIVIIIVDCDLPIILSLTAEPTRIIGKGETKISWITSGADEVYLEEIVVSASGYQMFTITAARDFILRAKNKCGEITKTIHVDYEPCSLCDSIFFHADGSQTKIFNGNPCLSDPPWHLPYTLYNRSQYCDFDVKIHWIITRDNVKYDEGEYTVHVPAGANPLNLFFDYPQPAGSTIQCCWSKITLKIVGCTNY